MTTWMARGLVFAAGMVFLRLVQGALINASPTNAGTISLILIVLFGLAVSIWGLLDGSADARANPDPDRRRDLAMRWLMSGLVAGVLSGLVAWIISLFYGPIYVDGLIPEVLVFAAFTALLVFLPAISAVAIGRMVVDRKRPPQPARHHVGADVFEAVSEDDDYVHASRRESDWRQEYREAIREQHEDAERRTHDHG